MKIYILFIHTIKINDIINHKQKTTNSERMLFMEKYSWQRNELGQYSYLPVKEKKTVPAWLIAVIISLLVSAAAITIFTVFILPNMRPTTTISYSAPTPSDASSSQASGAVVSGFEGIGEKLSDSVVSIESRGGGGGFFSHLLSSSGGSGVVVSADGYILTNTSMLNQNTGITVRLSDGTSLEAEVVGSDLRTDCAVLKIDRKDLKPIEFTDSSALVSGTSVAALGRILNSQLGTSLTVGTICGINNSVTLQSGKSINLIQTDACPGDSAGSILLDKSGKAVGMVTSMISSNSENIALCIPSNDIMQVIESIINIGIAPSGLVIGIMGQEAEYGIIVETVNDGSAAAKAGMKVGDLIMKADGTPVKSVSDLNKIRDSHKAGEDIILTVYRDGEVIDIAVRLG